MSKEDSDCVDLSAILIEFVFKMSKNYYSEVFFEECKYIVKEGKQPHTSMTSKFPSMILIILIKRLLVKKRLSNAKQYILLNDGIGTLPYGRKDLN